jgi:hypothetical protein
MANGNLIDFFQNLNVGENYVGVTIAVGGGTVETPNMNGISRVNEEEFDCGKCPEDANNGNCDNVSLQPYLNTFNNFMTQDAPKIEAQFENYRTTFQYGKLEVDALRLADWTKEVLDKIAIHDAWIDHMQGNVQKDKRCCRDWTGENNFNNSVVPVSDALRGMVQEYHDKMVAYASQGELSEEELLEGGTESEQYQNQLENAITNVTDALEDDKTRIKLIAIAVGVILLLLVVYFARR